MPANRNVLCEVKPKLDRLVAELAAQGADRAYVLYILEREIAALRREAPHEGVDIHQSGPFQR
ncbi:hypothetical protein SB748_29020 [Rhizobium sp. SIMBA_035]